MKYIFWILCCLLTFLLPTGSKAWAQAPTWQMAVAAGGAGNSAGAAITADGNGNVYIVGQFAGTVTFGAVTLTSAGSRDVYVTKWNSRTGGFVWAQQMGGAGWDGATGIAVRGASVYVAGNFNGATATFGAINLTNTPNPSASSLADGFIAKLTDTGSTGVFSWVRQISGAGDDAPSGIAVNDAGIYVTGSFQRPAASFGGITLASAGNYDVFVAKLADAGATASFVWAQRAGGSDVDLASALAVNGPNVYVTGHFTSSPASFGNTSLTHVGSIGFDIFVAKLIDAGNAGSFVWAQRGGGPAHEQAEAIAVSGANVYVAGLFSDGAAVFGGTALPNAGDLDLYVAKLTDAGTSASFTWAQGAGGPDSDVATGLTTRENAVYVTGSFRSPAVVFGPITVANVGPLPNPGPDGFIAKLTDAGPTGSFAWALPMGGAGVDVLGEVAVVGKDVYVSGAVAPPARFGTISIAAPAGNPGVACIASLTDLATAAPGTCAGGTADECPLIIPNIITPNGDGQNDRLVCQGATPGMWCLHVYNRWGQAVYQKSNYSNEWDAAGQPAGVYYYLLNHPTDGRRYRGWVEVIR